MRIQIYLPWKYVTVLIFWVRLAVRMYFFIAMQNKQILTLLGNIDHRSMSFFREQLSELAGDGIIDARNVGYINGSGLAALLALAKRVEAHRISIINVRMPLRDLFRLTRLDEHFVIYDTL